MSGKSVVKAKGDHVLSKLNPQGLSHESHDSHSPPRSDRRGALFAAAALEGEPDQPSTAHSSELIHWIFNHPVHVVHLGYKSYFIITWGITTTQRLGNLFTGGQIIGTVKFMSPFT